MIEIFFVIIILFFYIFSRLGKDIVGLTKTIDKKENEFKEEIQKLEKKHQEEIKILSKHLILFIRANINKQDEYGRTELIKAVQDSDLDSVEMFLNDNYRANILLKTKGTEKNKFGMTAFMCAEQEEKILDNDYDDKYLKKLKNNNKKIIKLLKDQVNKIERISHIDGSLSGTMLIACVRSGDVELVETIIKSGGDVNLKEFGNTGDTPLFVANEKLKEYKEYEKSEIKSLKESFKEYKKIVKLLKDAGAKE